MSADNNDLTVTYGVKELLADIKNQQTAGFARVEKALEDTTRQLERRIEKVEGRVTSLESRQLVDEAKTDGAQKVRSVNQDRTARIWAGIGALAAVALAVWTAVHG